MMVKLKMIALSLLMSGTFAYAQSGLGSVKGSVKDEKTKQAIPLCKVKIVQNGTTKGGAQTDFDGKFQINGVQPGTYDVEISMVEYQTSITTGVIVSPDKITFLDNLTIGKPEKNKDLGEVKLIAYKVPLIDKDGGASGATVTERTFQDYQFVRLQELLKRLEGLTRMKERAKFPFVVRVQMVHISTLMVSKFEVLQTCLNQHSKKSR